MSLFGGVKPAEPIVPFYNTGGLLDIPTAAFVIGTKGQFVMSGGFGPITGVVGKPHMFKSTILKSMLYRAFTRIYSTIKTSALMYDTEITVVESHQRDMVMYMCSHYDDIRISYYDDVGTFIRDMFSTENNDLVFTNRNQYNGNEYYELLRKLLNGKNPENKQKRGEEVVEAFKLIDSPFLDRDGKSPYKILAPTFGDVDSLSEFRTEADDTIQEAELGDSSANPGFMREGLNKTRFLMGMPQLTTQNHHYVGMTGQIGKEIAMSTGPMPAAPQKQLSAMKNGDVLKGVSGKFISLSNVCWQAAKTTPSLQTHRIEDGPKYPIGETKGNKFDNDLFEVDLTCIRNKNGPTGFTIQIMVSQSLGVLFDMSEFHFIKTNEYWALDGSQQNFVCTFKPDVPLSRTTIRKKLGSEPGLQRAINIASEMLQIKLFNPGLWAAYGCTPKELYDGIKEKGYDWEELLQTRGWWHPDENHPLKELCTLDILRMNRGDYFPYWMDKETKRAKV